MPAGNNSIHFNYIITIHNKQDLIREVLLNVLQCMHADSTAVPVLDGCTDGSESIVDEIIQSNPGRRIKKVYAADVHELKAINMGIMATDQTGTGFNIILQDDVVLTDHAIEARVRKLYAGKEKLGIVSFRHGANLSRALARKNKNMLPIRDHIENIRGHNYDPFSVLQTGCFTYREIPIKSPICIPFEVVNTVGLPDEVYAPWDDIAYCYSVTEAGFNNGVYAIDFESDISWGTTRKKKQQLGLSEVERKNIAIFKERNKTALLSGKKRDIYSKKIYRIDAAEKRNDAISSSKFFSGLKAHFIKELRYFKNLILDN